MLAKEGFCAGRKARIGLPSNCCEFVRVVGGVRADLRQIRRLPENEPVIFAIGAASARRSGEIFMT